MRYVRQENFSQGMLVGQEIYIIRNGRALLQGGVGLKLTDSIISVLRRNKLEKLLIQDEFSEGIQPDEALPASSENDLRIEISKIIESVNPKKPSHPSADFLKFIDKIVNEISISSIMPFVRQYDEENYILEHSINVGILSISLGKRCGIMGAKLKELAIGSLFHDIGLTRIDPSLYFRDFEKFEDGLLDYKRHTIIGWKILKECLGFKNLIPYLALRHHELLDYTGYPGGSDLSSKLHQVARVTAVIEEYEARSTRTPTHKPEDTEYIVQEVLKNSKKFDPVVVEKFCNTVVLFPTCSEVELSDGKEGVVEKQNEDKLRPVVRIKGDDGKPRAVDLSSPEHSALKITSCNY